MMFKASKFKGLFLACIAVLCFGLLPILNVPVAKALGTTYYVDSAGGSDTNDGLSPSTAWQHLSKVNATTFAPGDTILLKAGGSWSEQLFPKGNGASGNTIKIDKYGTGNKPAISFNIAAARASGGELNSGGAVFLKNQSYWEISNLNVTNSLGNGVTVLNFNGGTKNYIRLRGLEVHDTGKNGILITSDGTTVSRWNDVIIENNVITNAGDQAAIRTEANSKAARSTKLIVRSNAITNTKYDGIVVTDSTAPLIEYNVVNGAGTDAPGCIAGIWNYDTDDALFQYNEAFNTKNTKGLCDRQGFDADHYTKGTTFQYNYSHDNAGGFLLVMPTATTVTVRYNMILEAGFGGGTVGAVTAYNNTIYVPANAADPAVSSSSSTSDMLSTGTAMNNIIYRAGTVGTMPTDGASKSDNLLYGTALPSGYDSSNFVADPKFAGPLPTIMPTGINSVGAFKLQSGSPAINAGVSIPANGGKDYFGNPVSSDSANLPNIGADNSYNTMDSASIVDNGQSGYSEVSGTFADSSVPGYNNSGTRYSASIGANVKWTPTLAAGSYKVSIYRVVNASSDNNAQIRVNSAAGLSGPISVDYTTGVSGWYELGNYTFSAGTSGYITNTFSGSIGKNLRADAVKFELLSPAIIVDNGTSGYSEVSGTFGDSAMLGYNNSTTRYSFTPGASAKWTPTLAAGTYKVSIYRVASASSDNNAQIRVYSAAGLSGPISVDYTMGISGWYDLGTYSFNAGTSGYVTNTFSGNTGKNLRADAVKFELQ
jgi:hypothetical protein